MTFLLLERTLVFLINRKCLWLYLALTLTSQCVLLGIDLTPNCSFWLLAKYEYLEKAAWIYIFFLILLCCCCQCVKTRLYPSIQAINYVKLKQSKPLEAKVRCVKSTLDLVLTLPPKQVTVAANPVRAGHPDHGGLGVGTAWPDRATNVIVVVSNLEELEQWQKTLSCITIWTK